MTEPTVLTHNDTHTVQLTLVSVRRIHGRAVLTLSSGDALSMPRAMLRERPYRSGMPFDRAAFDAFMQERAYPFAMEKAVALLAMRGRTQKELRDALVQNAYPEEVIERVLIRMDEAGYVDDEGFAAQWIASRTQKGMGTRRIRMELREKGVDAETIETAISELDEDDLIAGAMKAARKAANGKDLAVLKDKQKIIAALARRGYDYAMAKQAIALLLEEQE